MRIMFADFASLSILVVRLAVVHYSHPASDPACTSLYDVDGGDHAVNATVMRSGTTRDHDLDDASTRVRRGYLFAVGDMSLQKTPKSRRQGIRQRLRTDCQ